MAELKPGWRLVTDEERAALIETWTEFGARPDVFLPASPEECVDALIVANLPDDATFHFDLRWTPQPEDTPPGDKVPFSELPKWIVVVVEDSDE